MGEVHDLFSGMVTDGETDKARADRCMERINEVLAEENCGMMPYFNRLGGNETYGVLIFAKPYLPVTSPN